MDKENNFNCPCICVCSCVIMFLFCCLITKGIGLDRNLWSNVFFIAFSILFLICTCMLFKLWNDNKKNISEIKDIVSSQKQITEKYKDLLKTESCLFYSCSSKANDNLYKTIDKIIEAFSIKNCDDSKLRTLKDIIDTVIKYDADLYAKSDCAQNQEDEKKA